jgi:hypothetical protein
LRHCWRQHLPAWQHSSWQQLPHLLLLVVVQPLQLLLLVR